MRTTEGPPSALSAGDTFTLTLEGEKRVSNFAGIEFYSDAACKVKVAPTAGSLVGWVRPLTLPNTDIELADQHIDLSVTNDQLDWSGPAVSFKVTGLSTVSGSGAAYFRVRVWTGS